MPKWVHDRVERLKAKNPEMPESMAWGIAYKQHKKKERKKTASMTSFALEMCKLAIAVKPSIVHGKGVFATREYSKGEHIGRVMQRLTRPISVDKDFKKTILGRYLNHAKHPNVSAYKTRSGMSLKARQPITKGDEFLGNYKEINGIVEVPKPSSGKWRS